MLKPKDRFSNSSMANISDKDLKKDLKVLHDALSNGEQGKRMFFEHFYQLVYRTVRRYLQNHDDLEEIINDSFLKIFKAMKKFDRERSNVRPWIKRIAINTAIDRYRKIMRKPEPLQINEDALQAQVSPEVIDDLGYGEILTLVESLPVVHRTVFYLYEIEGYKHDEISAMLKISESVSRVYLSRAKTKLRELLILNFN